MASGPKVSVILELLDKMTQPLNGAKSAVTGFGAKLKGMGSEAMQLLNNRLIQGVGFAGLVAGVGKAFAASDQLEASLRKLEGTAKITGVPLATLEGIAGRAESQFKLSKVQANDFAVEMAKLATKAGDVGKAGPALDAFLEIGAARGLTAAQTLKSVQQAILGIDEGTDKLFNANPSVLYDEYATAIGNTAGKLTEQQKAQALMTRALQDATQVGGSYAAYLQSAAGQQEVLKNRTAEAAAALGLAMNDVRQAVLPLLVTLADGFRNFIGGIQVMALDLGFAWDGIAPAVKKMSGNVLLTLSSLIGESRAFLFVFGDAAVDMANRMGDAGVRMVREAAKAQRNIAAGRELAYEELGQIANAGESTLTAIAGTGSTNRTGATEEEVAANEGARKKAAARLADLAEEVLIKEIRWQQNLTEAQAKAYIQRERDLGGHLASTVTTTAGAYTRLDQLNTLLAAGFTERVTPSVQRTATEFRELDITARTVPVVLDQVAVSATQAGEAVKGTGDSLDQSVRSAADAAHGLGLLDDAGKGVVTTMVNVGGAIRDAIVGGITTGGVIGIVAGVGSLLKGLFGGKSPAQIAAERELRKNTETIAENSRRVGDLTRLSSSGGKLAAVQGVLEGLAPQFGELGTRRASQFRATIAGAFASAGLGLGDLDAVAKDLGITIRTQAGTLFEQGLRDLLAVLGEIEPTQFAQTFEGARDQLRAETDLFDLSDADVATRLAGIAGGPLGSSVIGQRLGGLDFGTAEGRTAGIAAIQQLFSDLPGLGAADLGGLTGSQFVAVLTELKDLLSTELPAVLGVDDGGALGGDGMGAESVPTGVPVPSVSLADLVAVATTSNDYLAQIADFTSVLPTWTAPAGSTEAGAPGGVQVTIGEIVVHVPAGSDGGAIAEAMAIRMDAELGRLYRLGQLATGSAVRA